MVKVASGLEGVEIVEERVQSSQKDVAVSADFELGKRQAAEIVDLRRELNELLQKHNGLESEFQVYKKACDERFGQLMLGQVPLLPENMTTGRNSKLEKTSAEEEVQVQHLISEANTAASTSASTTPVKNIKGTREKWKAKDAEIITSNDIRMLPRDLAAFDAVIPGNREQLISKVKEMSVDRDFRVRIPYSDRFDRDGILQLTFMCSMASFFHRKRENFIGCPFRLVYKATDTNIHAFKLFHVCEHHNHTLRDGIDQSPVTIVEHGQVKAEAQ